MSGSKIGGKKVVETRVQKYMDQGYSEIEARKMVSDDYRRIGAIGGKKGNKELNPNYSGGFAGKTECYCDVIAGPHTKPQCAGKIGGGISKRVRKAKDVSKQIRKV